jgi:hypothetical protein
MGVLKTGCNFNIIAEKYFKKAIISNIGDKNIFTDKNPNYRNNGN